MGDQATEITFIIDVQAVTGSPTSGTITAKVQSVIPHTTGNQYLTERLFDLDAVQKVNLTAEGEDWPNPICTDLSSFPITVQRTYFGFGHDLKLVLTPAFVGGTSPGFTYSVVQVVKG